tara:strand:+ start:20416 stop:20544 length:129 start_codon:yes stop_codon:yes gene_type:complete
MNKELETYEELTNWLQNYYPHIWNEWIKYVNFMEPYMEGEEE